MKRSGDFLLLLVLVFSLIFAFPLMVNSFSDNITGKVSVSYEDLDGKPGWTQWFDTDNPSLGGDFERTNLLKKKYPQEICENPTEIECQTISGLKYLNLF